MPYGLGIDLGTGRTAAAISRTDAGSRGPEVVALNAGAPSVPTVVHLADDGTLLVGTAAESLVRSDPTRVFRGFLGAVGEPPAAGPGPSPAALAARLVRWVTEVVARREGGPAQRITLAHPASWELRECHAVHDALSEAGLSGIALVPAPVAVATAYAAEQEIAPQSTLAIYDLGSTFSASVVRRHETGFGLLGVPQTLQSGGGARFDELVLARVLEKLGDPAPGPDPDEQAAGLARLRAACEAAREALSDQTEVRVPVALPGLRTEVRLTADELNTVLAPALRTTRAVLRMAISAAGRTPADLTAVVTSGGCAHLPQVAELLAAELGRPVAVPADPALATARGAASLAARSNTARPRNSAAPQPPHPMPVAPQPPHPAPQPPRLAPAAPQPQRTGPAEWTEQRSAVHDTAELSTSELPVVAPRPPSSAPRFASQQRTLLAGAAAIVALAVIVLPLTLLRGQISGSEQATSTVLRSEPPRSGQAVTDGNAGVLLTPAGTGATGSTATTPGSPSPGTPGTAGRATGQSPLLLAPGTPDGTTGLAPGTTNPATGTSGPDVTRTWPTPTRDTTTPAPPPVTSTTTAEPTSTSATPPPTSDTTSADPTPTDPTSPEPPTTDPGS